MSSCWNRAIILLNLYWFDVIMILCYIFQSIPSWCTDTCMYKPYNHALPYTHHQGYSGRLPENQYSQSVSRSAVKSQTAVTAYLKSKQLLLFAFGFSAKANSSNCLFFKWAVTAVCLCTAGRRSFTWTDYDGRSVLYRMMQMILLLWIQNIVKLTWSFLHVSFVL